MASVGTRLGDRANITCRSAGSTTGTVGSRAVVLALDRREAWRGSGRVEAVVAKWSAVVGGASGRLTGPLMSRCA